MALTDVSAAQSGDKQAFARLVQKHQGVVCAIALAITRDVSLSEEVAQETFLHAWLGLPKLRDPGRFNAWLRQLARNQASFARRSRARFGARIATNEQVVADAPCAAPDPAEALQRKDDARVVNETLSSLPPEIRELLVLYYREELSITHVAERLGIATEAAKKRLARARAQLQATLLERFGVVAKKTAPGAAFVATICGALPDARAAATTTTISTTLLGGATASALLVTLGLAWYCGARAVAQGSEPAVVQMEGPHASTSLAAQPESVPVNVSPHPTPLPVRKTLNREDVRAVIKPGLSDVWQCVSAFIDNGGKVPAKIRLKWVVEPSGHTKNAGVDSSEVIPAALEECIVRVIARWEFPPFEEGLVPLIYPLRLADGPTPDDKQEFRHFLAKLMRRDTKDSPKTISTDVRDGVLAEVAETLGGLGGIRILVADDIQHEKVMLRVHNVSFPLALDVLLLVNNLRAEPGGDAVRIHR